MLLKALSKRRVLHCSNTSGLGDLGRPTFVQLYGNETLSEDTTGNIPLMFVLKVFPFDLKNSN